MVCGARCLAVLISHVLPEQLDLVWNELEPQIIRGLTHGQGDECYPELMKAQILNERMQLWAIQDEEQRELRAGVVVSVRDSKTRKVWVELLAGENIDEWASDLEDTLRTFKERVGASTIEASCRLGLAKYLQSRGTGWKRKAIVMELT